jgi:hypothetical protein
MNPKMIDDPISHSVDNYAAYLLKRYVYNLERGNFERALRWGQAYEALNEVVQRVVWEPADA